MTEATAPGKIILFGEHAVVYGRPAIAVPVRDVRAKVTIQNLTAPSQAGSLWVESKAIGLSSWLHEIDGGHPLAKIITLTLEAIGLETVPSLRLAINSSIPLASGLGSGAAVSVAVSRALSEHLGRPLALKDLSSLAFEVDRIHHGTPSGIDNTVVVYDRPVYFIPGKEPERLEVGLPFMLIIGDSGQPSATIEAVAQVRDSWISDKPSMEALFDSIGSVTNQAREAIRDGDLPRLGGLMNQNQSLLLDLGVSTPTLELLIEAAGAAGAIGVKVSGAGLGGNIIALVDQDSQRAVKRALIANGASKVLYTEVSTEVSP